MDSEEFYNLIKQYKTRCLTDEEYALVTEFVNKNEDNIQHILAQLSLKHKWYAESTAEINDLCPFCLYQCFIMHNTRWCDFNDDEQCLTCLCPPDICSDRANDGLVSELEHEYDCVCQLDPEDFKTITDLFKKL